VVTVLEIKDLHVEFRVFGGTLKVLDGLNMVVNKGEKVGLVGEAGCGKTTTMKAIMRILPMPPARITKGEVLFLGADLLRANLKRVRGVRGKGISMIFQDPTAALNPVFTIGEQLMDVIRCARNLGKAQSRSDIKARTVGALRAVSMPDPIRIMKNYPVQLSGGMRQRACIAMALVNAGELLIADEPGTSLDVTIQAQILRLLNEIVEERGTSVILISHALGAVKNLTDRVYVMYAGTMVEVTTTNDLFANPVHPYTQALMAAVPKLTGEGLVEGIVGRIPSYLSPPTGCRYHPRCKNAMSICEKKKPPFFNVAGNGHKVACFLCSGELN